MAPDGLTMTFALEYKFTTKLVSCVLGVTQEVLGIVLISQGVGYLGVTNVKTRKIPSWMSISGTHLRDPHDRV